MLIKSLNYLNDKIFFYISLSLLFFNLSSAKDVDIQENVSLSFVCDLEKILRILNIIIKLF